MNPNLGRLQRDHETDHQPRPGTVALTCAFMVWPVREIWHRVKSFVRKSGKNLPFAIDPVRYLQVLKYSKSPIGGLVGFVADQTLHVEFR